MKGGVAILPATVLLGLLSAVCRAQDFSADVAYDAAKSQDGSASSVPSTTSSKLYVSKDKMRLDSRGFSQTILLVDFGNQKTVAIFPLEKAYQPLGFRPSQYFRVTDAENACPDWRKVVGEAITCEKVGNDVVDGRKTVKYQNKSVAANGSVASVWIDPALHFVIKWEDAEGGAELRNIKEGPQAADLFVVPPAYDVLKPKKKAPGKAKAPRPK